MPTRATYELARTMDKREATTIDGKTKWRTIGVQHVSVTVTVDLDQLARKLGPQAWITKRGVAHFMQGAIIVETRKLR